MSDILQIPVKEFLTKTAAKLPTPGGGSVTALCGALAAALAAMALEYTVGKKAFAAHDEYIRRALASFKSSSEMLQELIKEDIAAYEKLSGLLKLPDDLRQKSPDYLPTVIAAIRAPQAAAGFAINILDTCSTLLDKTSKHLISDLGIAAIYAHATVHASELNVRINLPLLPNQEEAEVLRDALHTLTLKADGIYTTLRTELLTRI